MVSVCLVVVVVMVVAVVVKEEEREVERSNKMNITLK